MRISAKRVVGIVALAAALLWSISGVDFSEVVQIWATVDRAAIGVVFLLTFTDLMVRSWAWKIAIDPLKQVAYRDVLSIYIIGLFSSLVLPFRMGDLAQGYFLGRREDISKVSTLSTVVVRRLFEMISLAVIMVFVVAGLSFDFPLRQRGLLLGSILLAGIAVSWLVVIKRREISAFVYKNVNRVSPKAADRMQAFLVSAFEGAAAMQRFRSVAAIMILSLAAWFVEMLMILITTAAMDIQLTLVESAVVLLTLNLGLLISPTPGNIGTYQFLSILALSWFSVSKTRALSFSVIFQIIQGLPILIGGPLLLAAEATRSSRTPRKTEESLK